MASDLLEYSRVSTEKFAVTPVELSKISEETVHMLAAEIQVKQASIKIDPDLGIVIGHEATLIQVMLNLLGNALKYGKLGVDPVIDVRAERRNNAIKVTVQDNGV